VSSDGETPDYPGALELQTIVITWSVFGLWGLVMLDFYLWGRVAISGPCPVVMCWDLGLWDWKIATNQHA